MNGSVSHRLVTHVPRPCVCVCVFRCVPAKKGGKQEVPRARIMKSEILREEVVFTWILWATLGQRWC